MTQTTGSDIKQILYDTIAAYNNSDPTAIPTHLLTGWSPFAGSGKGIDPERLAEAFKMGLRTDLRWEQLYVRLYGKNDRIAIATGYLNGWIRLPTGERAEGPWDFRKIWIRDEDGWRMAPEGELPAPPKQLQAPNE